MVLDEAALRLVFFLGTFFVCAAVEWLRPKRQWRESRLVRWRINLGIILLNTLIVRLTVGAIAVSAAVWAQQAQVGLFNWLEIPTLLAAIFGFLLLDLAIWYQHWVTHRWALLWRLHQVHHTDLDLDVTTALRFHPLEIVLSLIYKAVLILLFGIDPYVVLIFEVVLNASAIFTHANISLPHRLDHLLRWLICTPDMHRIHHSVYRKETDSNYGFFLSIWDRIFLTYTVEPQDTHLQMQLGLSEYRQQPALGLVALLKLPLIKSGSRSSLS